MNLSQIEKRIPQTLTNSKDVIQTDLEYARRSSRARSTRGQENEAWALYKKIPSRESWGDLSGDPYIICPKPPSPAGKILDKNDTVLLDEIKERVLHEDFDGTSESSVSIVTHMSAEQSRNYSEGRGSESTSRWVIKRRVLGYFRASDKELKL